MCTYTQQPTKRIDDDVGAENARSFVEGCHILLRRNPIASSVSRVLFGWSLKNTIFKRSYCDHKRLKRRNAFEDFVRSILTFQSHSSKLCIPKIDIQYSTTSLIFPSTTTTQNYLTFLAFFFAGFVFSLFLAAAAAASAALCASYATFILPLLLSLILLWSTMGSG